MDYNSAKCPSCGGELICNDIFNFSIETNEAYANCSGYCENCGKKWIWLDVFKYDHSEDYNEEWDETEEDYD